MHLHIDVYVSMHIVYKILDKHMHVRINALMQGYITYLHVYVCTINNAGLSR